MMEWSKEPPKLPGHYWWRSKPGKHWNEVVFIESQFMEGFVAWQHGQSGYVTLKELGGEWWPERLTRPDS